MVLKWSHWEAKREPVVRHDLTQTDERSPDDSRYDCAEILPQMDDWTLGATFL